MWRSFFQELWLWAGRVTQVVEHLSSNPTTTKKKGTGGRSYRLEKLSALEKRSRHRNMQWELDQRRECNSRASGGGKKGLCGLK
jgi:hypothetical protein